VTIAAVLDVLREELKDVQVPIIVIEMKNEEHEYSLSYMVQHKLNAVA
jgi:hypothetical protein